MVYADEHLHNTFHRNTFDFRKVNVCILLAVIVLVVVLLLA